MARGRARAGKTVVVLAVLAFGAPALAQTCRGAAPATGQAVSGPVMHVIDGQTLCLAQGPTPDRWIPLTVLPSATPLPADRQRLMAAAFSRSLVCRVTGGRGPVKSAACTIGGRPLDALLADPATVTEANAWR
jgi:hypothetical protein